MYAALTSGGRFVASVEPTWHLTPYLAVGLGLGYAGLISASSGGLGPPADPNLLDQSYTYLDSEVLQSVSDFCLTTPGAAGCANSAAVPDPQAGQDMLQTPKHSGSLFTTYMLPFGLVERREAVVLRLQMEDFEGTMARIDQLFKELDITYVLNSFERKLHETRGLSTEVDLQISYRASLNLHEITAALMEMRINRISWREIALD